MKPKRLMIALVIVAGCALQPQSTAAPALPSPALAELVIVPPPTSGAAPHHLAASRRGCS